MSKEPFPSSDLEIEEEIEGETKVETPIQDNSPILPYFPSFYSANYSLNRSFSNQIQHTPEAVDGYIKNFHTQDPSQAEYDSSEESDSDLQRAIQASITDQGEDKELPGKDIDETSFGQSSQDRFKNLRKSLWEGNWKNTLEQSLKTLDEEFNSSESQDFLTARTKFDDENYSPRILPSENIDETSTGQANQGFLDLVFNQDENQDLLGSTRKIRWENTWEGIFENTNRDRDSNEGSLTNTLESIWERSRKNNLQKFDSSKSQDQDDKLLQLPGKDIDETFYSQKNQGWNQDWGQGGSGAEWKSSQTQDLMTAKTRFDDDQPQKPHKGHVNQALTIQIPEQLFSFDNISNDDFQGLQDEPSGKLNEFEMELCAAGVPIEEIINQRQLFAGLEKSTQSPSAQRLEDGQAKTRNSRN